MKKIINWIKKNHSLILRIFMFVVYFWFGGLKLIGLSPAEDFVAKAIPFVNDDIFFLILGIVEVFIGIGFLIKPITKIVFWTFLFHMMGTFLPFVTIPSDVFTIFPHGLSLEGQYIIKNLALVGVGFSIYRGYVYKTIED